MEKKYGKELIDKIFSGGYLMGCTVVINKDGTEDFFEIDIVRAIREMNGEEFVDWD